MRTVHSTPELQANASKGNLKFWQGFVLTDEDTGEYFTQTAFWQETAKGLSQKQFSVPTKIEGKNIGKANETSPAQQARSEMDSTEKKQRDKGYAEAGQKADIRVLPMLAHKWGDRKHSVDFPLYAQPKLDGVRCLTQDGKMWSRQGKEFIPEVYQHLIFEVGSSNSGVILDGELMLPHQQHSFQDTMKAVKKYRPESAGMLEYHVYDCYLTEDPEASFETRYAVVLDLLKNAPKGVIAVQTEKVANESEIADWHTFFTHPDQGYEGTILRTPGGIYTAGHRSVNLLKHKDFVDDEYVIIGVGEGKGKFEGAIMFTCVTPEGKEFDCGLKGSMDDRREMFSRKDEYIGRLLTVKYQNLTEDGIPRFPVGVSIREPEQG